MDQVDARLVALFAIGVFVAVLSLQAPEVGAALSGAATVVALLAQFMFRK